MAMNLREALLQYGMSDRCREAYPGKIRAIVPLQKHETDPKGRSQYKEMRSAEKPKPLVSINL
jgi:hypothetical protein